MEISILGPQDVVEFEEVQENFQFYIAYNQEYELQAENEVQVSVDEASSDPTEHHPANQIFFLTIPFCEI